MKKILLIIACLLVPGIAMAAFTLPWTTTFNCADWPNYSATLNCDGIGKGLADSITYGQTTYWEQVTADANYPGGGGGKGQRHWMGDGNYPNTAPATGGMSWT